MNDETVAAMREGIRQQAEVVKAQRRIFAVLSKFDDETARRIVGAVAVLTGAAQATIPPE